MQRVVVCMRSQEHHGYVVLVADRFGRRDAVDVAGEPHVHQDQIRMQTPREVDCLLTPRGSARDRISEIVQRLDQVQSEDAVVLYDQNARTPRAAHAVRRGGPQGRCMISSQFCLSSTASRASSTASSTLFAVDSSPPFLIVSTASSTSSPACSSGPFFSQAARPSAAVAASTAAITLIFMLSSRQYDHT